jgi:4-hydroxy-tetrahydrodipicolinate synthase
MFKGSGVAIITPFKDGKINYDKFEELLEWHVKEKTDAIIVCGTTGESATLSDEEKKRTHKIYC